MGGNPGRNPEKMLVTEGAPDGSDAGSSICVDIDFSEEDKGQLL